MTPTRRGAPPDYSDQVERVTGFLVNWRKSDHPPEKFVWVLEHDYSEAGRSFAALKNTDAAVARVLSVSADRAGCELYMATVHVNEEGIAVPHINYGDWDDMDADEMLMDELLGRSRWLDGWMDGDGRRPTFGEVPFLREELLPENALDDAEPDDRWLHEATGNANMTIEQVYRRAAFVIWAAVESARHRQERRNRGSGVLGFCAIRRCGSDRRPANR